MKKLICDDSLDIIELSEMIATMTDEEFEKYLKEIK